MRSPKFCGSAGNPRDLVETLKGFNQISNQFSGPPRSSADLISIHRETSDTELDFTNRIFPLTRTRLLLDSWPIDNGALQLRRAARA